MTVTLVLYLEKRKLGVTAEQIFDSVDTGKVNTYFPAMVLAEILYLSEKGRISVNIADVCHLLKTVPNFVEFPMNVAVIKVAEQITDIPELHDRLIAATARHLNLDLITNDATIRNSASVNTVW